jgi:hypothetical protein
MRSSSSSALIDNLVDDLTPVRRLDARVVTSVAGLIAFATMAFAAGLFGLRPDVVASKPDSVFLLASGLVFILALAASLTVIRMSRPSVGQTHGGWIWAATGVGLLPLGALLSLAIGGLSQELTTEAGRGFDCLVKATTLGLGFAVFHILLLRKGAPTSPERAGWLVGVASGCLGSFAYGLHCPSSDLVHLGVWHVLPIIISAALGRVAVPSLVRW